MSTGLVTPPSSSEIEQNFEALRFAVGAYDPSDPQASHLRKHQVSGIYGFREAVMDELTIDSYASGMGIAMVSPTGSGKTVMQSEILRMMHQGLRERTPEGDLALRALVGVPRIKIGRQTYGEKEQQGLRSFAPDLTVTGTGRRGRVADADVTIACYQSFPGMERSGELKRLNPNVVTADEMHLVINGKASETLRRLLPGRLAVGFSATPSYSQTRTAFDMFPLVGMHETIREGINDGYISPLEVRLIQASTRIIAGRTRLGELNEADVFRALREIPDFNLIRAIVTNQAQRNRVGIIHCPPGHDRLISRELARRLSNQIIDTPTGRRKLRVSHVDGDMTAKELDTIFKKLEAHEIDGITNVDLVNVGWDGDVEYGINTRPVMSVVLAEQGLGRVMRWRQGKVAEYFDLVYDIATPDQTRERPQVTAIDVLNETIVVQGHRFASTDSIAPKSRAMKGTLDPELRAAMNKLDQLPIDEIRITNGQQSVPSNWVNAGYLGYVLGIPESEVIRRLSKAKVGSKTQQDGEKQFVLYPPRSEALLAEMLGFEPLLASDITMGQIISDPELSKGRSASVIRRVLAAEDCEQVHKLDEKGRATRAYDRDEVTAILNPKTNIGWHTKRVAPARRAPAPARTSAVSKTTTHRRPMKETADEHQARRKEEDKKPIDTEAVGAFRNWLQTILVDVRRISHQEERGVRLGQENLATQLRMHGLLSYPPGFEQAVRESGLRPTKRMREIMQEHQISWPALLLCSRQASRVTETTMRRGTY